MAPHATVLETPPAGVRTSVTRTLDEYATLVRTLLMPVTVSSRHEQFPGRLRVAGRGSMFCFEATAPEHTIERTPELIAAGEGNGFYKLSLVLDGESMLVQDSREAVLRPGDLALYDTSRPYSLVSSEGARTAIVMFPREWLSLSPAAVRQLTAVRFDGSRGLAASVSPFITQLMAQLEQFTRPSGSRLPYNIVDLVGTMLASELDEREAGDAASMLLTRVLNYIEEHLGDEDLGPTKIAAAHFVSPRYLQVLFQRHGMTISACVRERRLERCRRDLEDASLAEETVATLAARWGFLEPTHFSRAFKKQFDLSPREVRSGAKERRATGSLPVRV